MYGLGLPQLEGQIVLNQRSSSPNCHHGNIVFHIVFPIDLPGRSIVCPKDLWIKPRIYQHDAYHAGRQRTRHTLMMVRAARTQPHFTNTSLYCYQHVLSASQDKWVVLKIVGPFWLWIIVRHSIFRGNKTGP